MLFILLKNQVLQISLEKRIFLGNSSFRETQLFSVLHPVSKKTNSNGFWG